MVPTIYVLRKNKKNIKKFQRKIFIFYNFKNLFILHGHVFVMSNRSVGTPEMQRIFVLIEKLVCTMKKCMEVYIQKWSYLRYYLS